MTPQLQSTIDKANISEGENVSDIQSLALRVRDLSQSVDWWNAAMIWSLVFAAIAAIAVVATTSIALSRAKRQSEAQAEFGRAKEQQLTANLKGKDLEIANANAKASGADERAGNAYEAAGKANEAAGRANERASKLELEAADARLKQRELEVRAEQLHKENLELEESVSPRLFKDQGGAARVLAAFVPVKVFVEYIADRECQRTAGQINAVLDMAKWTTFAPSLSPSQDERKFFDGVTVHLYTDGPTLSEVSRLFAAQEALIGELNKTGIAARSHAGDRNFPPGVIVIRVGMKPNPALQRLIREDMERKGFPQEMINSVVPPKKR